MQYDREKTFAVITGLICGLITLSATCLGIAYNLRTMGWFGLFPSLGLLILDLVLFWAAYIDYKEDGTLLEYASWTVKYAGALYLLLYGGVLAFVLATEGKALNQLSDVAKIKNSAFADCLKQGGTQRSCRELNAPIALQEESANEYLPTLKAWADSPAPKLAGPIFGIVGLIALTLVSKLTTEPKTAPALPLQSTTARLSTAPASAPLRVSPQSNAPTYPRVACLTAAFRFRSQGNGVVILLSRAGQPEKYCLMVSTQEANIFCTMPFAAMAREILTKKPHLEPDIRPHI